jgi:hypothetical protein
MEYFYNKQKIKTAAHFWLGEDTACTMFSTNGLKVNEKKGGKKEVHPDSGGRRICVMCQINYAKNKLG